ncbi:MAG TPA: ATP-binding protein, partial [Candidatus Sulfotelmatobacter sp.]|nr:ATP-binding protein [Candidatus Sulfotelmatobacter sp.]
RHNATLSLSVVLLVVVIVGLFVIRDLQTTNEEAENMYLVSVQGLRRIGELQYDAQETRRAMLFALTTNESRLQREYADKSRDADKRVTEGIAEYRQQAKRSEEMELANRLSRDWANYLPIRDDMLASILKGSTQEAVQLDLSMGVRSFDRVRQDLNEVKRLYEEKALQRLGNVRAQAHRSEVRLIGILTFTFLLSSAAVWAIQRSRMLNAIQLAKMQMEFVASVSHELRTPLAVLSSAADNIADGLVEGKAEMKKYCTVIQDQSRQMTGLVDEILLFASTEDRKNRYVMQGLRVSQIIEAVLASTKELIQGAGFEVETRVEPDLPMVTGDLAAISQCLQNLVGNAVKYSGTSRWIAVHAFTAPVGEGRGREVRISVSDRGIGIERSELANVFDPFYRTPRVSGLQIHGTGLGLSLAKRIAETMGGRLSVVSETSVGSTFTLHLPIAEGERLEMGGTAPQPSSSTPT